jgi:DNA-binding protein H-NS
MATMAPRHCLVYDRHQSLQPTRCSLSAFYGIVRKLLSLSQEENMTTLEKVQARLKKLQAQADALIAKESSAVLAKIRDLMSEHGLTTADIDAHIGGKKRGPKPGGKATAKAGNSLAKYRDPKSGATWSGHGRAPQWIASAKDRKKFLVDSNASSASSAAASKGKAAGRHVRGPQPAKYRDPKSGATWSGRGPAPAWLAGAKDRTKFLIAGGADTAPVASAGDVSKSKSAVKKASAAAGAIARKGQPKGPQPAKYRDPETGASWSGRGRAPAWLASAKDRAKFLIAGAGLATDAGGASKPKVAAKKVVAKKAASKTVKATTAPAAKKAAAKTAVSANVAAPKSAASKKAAGKRAAPTVKKTVAKKAPATKAVVAKKVVAKADVAATPEGLVAPATA